VLAIIQTFDPAGIAARNLAECLALQAKDANRYDPAMARLIDNLDYLARGNVPALKRICGVDDEDMADMIRELARLRSQARLPLHGRRAGRRDRARRLRHQARRRLGGRAQQRDPAAAAGQPDLL
jgi:DNA-directed RNA polymerase specialized sigma54-like protein